ncbi:MAG: NADP-dependent malic enzyme [Pelagibacterales bacterium]|nr:NADP-dependent malic enzyme [Pelagibacterales bacterium]
MPKSLHPKDALNFHSKGKPGKLEIAPTKPLTTARDLSLAYSPGVAVPCLEIEKNPSSAYDYTSKGNMVAVISNGTAVLGLGNIGALASKPVMEGKAVLFKRFADIDGIDLEVNTEDADEFINSVKVLGKSWGGINLEDIKAPECFIIEEKLSELLDIPVFHDDQHGTAIIAAAGLINALDITNRKIDNFTMVINGAGAAGIACAELLNAMGMPKNNIIMCDTKGIIHRDRTDLNQWKSAHAITTQKRSLAEALDGADVAFGLSVKGAFTKEMMKGMAANPIVFAMANPDPEITPEELNEVRPDAIIATGRSDYPNQVNNVLGFPFIFRGALDARASRINMEMKIAATNALAQLARQDVPDEVAAAYSGAELHYGPQYIIPTPFDPRLITTIPPAVAKAAAESGVAQKPIKDDLKYHRELAMRLDQTASMIQLISSRVKDNPKTMVFAEGEEERIIRAAYQWNKAGYGNSILIGRKSRVLDVIENLGLDPNQKGVEILNAKISKNNAHYADFLYSRLQRSGFLKRDCIRLINQDRNSFAACIVATGDADAMVTGTTRNYYASLKDIKRVIAIEKEKILFGLSIMITRTRTLFIADSTVIHTPTSEQLADIAVQAASKARALGHTPRVALLSFANFGNPTMTGTERIHEAKEILNKRKVDFEYDGEMSADVALNKELLELYPFSGLSEPANILIMPGLHSANIAAKLLGQVGGGQVLGPLLTGFSKPIQIMPMGANVSEILNYAIFAAHEVKNNKSTNKKMKAS